MRDPFEDDPDDISVQPAPESTAPAGPKRRGPGKPKGLPPSGGRPPAKITPKSADLRAIIHSRGEDLIDVALRIARGDRCKIGVRTELVDGRPQHLAVMGIPTIAQRLQALQLLLGKVIPDQKMTSTEITGPGGGSVKIDSRSLNLNVDAEPKTAREMVDGALLRAVQFHESTGLAMPPALVRELPALRASLAAAETDDE